MNYNRREFLEMLGSTVIAAVVPASLSVIEDDTDDEQPVITDGGSFVVTGTYSLLEDFEDVRWIVSSPSVKWGWEYSSPRICPGCNRSADHCWCVGGCIGQPYIQWVRGDFIEEEA